METFTDQYIVQSPNAKALSSLQACRTRAILTVDQAIEVYKMKFEGSKQPRASAIAEAFGVSEKAVRDIWKGRTWNRETMHLDPKRACMHQFLRLPGRPRSSSKGLVKFSVKSEEPTASGSVILPCGLFLSDFDGNVPKYLSRDEILQTHFACWCNVPQLPVSSKLDDPFHDDWKL